LRAGDTINVTVYGEAALSGNYQVDPDGFISIPTLDPINAAGFTRTELTQLLVVKLRDEYKKAQG